MTVPATLADRLRAQTRTVHVALEADLDLLAGPVGAVRYRRLLERFHGFYAVLEPRLASWSADSDLDWVPRQALPRLRADLARLGRPAPDLAALPRCPDVPSVAGTAEALGALYVVEGSALGGAVLARHLAAQPGLPAGAHTFLGSDGPDGADVGRRWRAWRAVAQGWVGDDHGRSDAVVATAVATFASLRRWLAPAARRAVA